MTFAYAFPCARVVVGVVFLSIGVPMIAGSLWYAWRHRGDDAFAADDSDGLSAR